MFLFTSRMKAVTHLKPPLNQTVNSNKAEMTQKNKHDPSASRATLLNPTGEAAGGQRGEIFLGSTQAAAPPSEADFLALPGGHLG